MNVGDLLIRAAVQTCVYWGNPVEDGYGTKTYDDPVELLCRWEQKQQLTRGLDRMGNTFEYIYVAYVLQDLDVEGVLYLGTLASLTAQEIATPSINDQACVIKQFEKIPALYSTTEFERKAYMTQWQYR
jgi:hypothetical protein